MLGVIAANRRRSGGGGGGGGGGSQRQLLVPSLTEPTFVNMTATADKQYALPGASYLKEG